MDSTQLKERIEKKLQAQCFVNEFSGGGDHFSALIISSHFIDKSKLQRHRLVIGLFRDEIESGEVHALTFKAYTPDEWENLPAHLKSY